MNQYQKYRKRKHLCLDCGEKAADGKTRCLGCLQKIAGRQKMYAERKKAENPDAYADAKRKYQKKWADKNRDHVREYHRQYYAQNFKS